jgi:hypothetical protein
MGETESKWRYCNSPLINNADEVIWKLGKPLTPNLILEPEIDSTFEPTPHPKIRT